VALSGAPDTNEEEGWNDTNEQPDRAAAEAGVRALEELYDRMAKMPKRS
jgi:hypothetical protein